MSSNPRSHQLHYVLFPFMAQCHMIPLVDIDKLLAQHGMHPIFALKPSLTTIAFPLKTLTFLIFLHKLKDGIFLSSPYQFTDENPSPILHSSTFFKRKNESSYHFTQIRKKPTKNRRNLQLRFSYP